MSDMTAIKDIKIIKDLIAFWNDNNMDGYGREKTALRRAISALEATIKPNLPLTEAQLFGLSDDDAVWPVACDGTIYVVTAQAAWNEYEALKRDGIIVWFFAAKPTPADIEAARKGKP